MPDLVVQFLQIWEIFLTCSILIFLPDFLFYLPTILNGWLTDMSMVGSDWVEVLNKLPYLTELHLSGCNLFGSISSPSFINFTSLAVISISYNNFDSKFPQWLLNISSLVFVDVSFNYIYGMIPLGLMELPILQYLDLSWNRNLRGSLSQLFSKSWRKIEVLNLRRSNLHGKQLTW